MVELSEPPAPGAEPQPATAPNPCAPRGGTEGPGVTLEEAYAACEALHRRHGTTYYWATRALPAVKRHHVHALYGFCRYADEIVDAMDDRPVAERAAALGGLADELRRAQEVGHSRHPVVHAVAHTSRAFDLHPSLFDRFLASMAMDLDTTGYDTYDDLARYMDGSAAVIGEMMLPILEPTDAGAALGGARALGIAFQLTNFLRDVGEDLDRGRVYLPREDLDRFGADPIERRVTPQWRELSRFEIVRIRALYDEADEGITHLPPRSAAGIRAARRLYGEILDRIEANDHDVFTRRARVPLPRKLAVAGAELVRARGR